MQFIGGIQGLNVNSITEYNKMLKNNASFEVDSNVDFENVLKSQTEKLNNAPQPIRSGIEVNMLVEAPQSSENSRDMGAVGSFAKSFSQSITGGLNNVNNANIAADKAQEAFAMGEDVSVHDVMIAAEKSALNMQLAMQLRNKLMTAYNEINNIRV